MGESPSLFQPRRHIRLKIHILTQRDPPPEDRVQLRVKLHDAQPGVFFVVRDHDVVGLEAEVVGAFAAHGRVIRPEIEMVEVNEDQGEAEEFFVCERGCGHFLCGMWLQRWGFLALFIESTRDFAG